MTVNGSSSQIFFSQAAEINPASEEGILWKRILENPESSIKNFQMAENMMLNNPYYVLFATEATAKYKFVNYPCLIYSSSKILGKVNISVNYTIKYFEAICKHIFIYFKTFHLIFSQTRLF